MCGRFTLRTPAKDIAQLFDVMVPDLAPRYNIAPSQDIAAVRQKHNNRELAMLRWGLVPFWADEPQTGYSTINARAESVAKNPSFRNAFKKRRCLVVADGFYGIPGIRYCTFDEPSTGRRKFQLHCYEPENSEVDRHLAFRDYLRANPAKAKEYDEEKHRCRELHPDDSHAYSDAKAAWITVQLPTALDHFVRSVD